MPIENTTYEDQINRSKINIGANIVTLRWLSQKMFVLPIPFNREHKNMLAVLKELMVYDEGIIAVNPEFTKLIVSQRTTVEKARIR